MEGRDGGEGRGGEGRGVSRNEALSMGRRQWPWLCAEDSCWTPFLTRVTVGETEGRAAGLWAATRVTYCSTRCSTRSMRHDDLCVE
jgi:hypothetical protein